MPYASDAQRRFMHVRHPKIARRWDAEIAAKKKPAKKVSKGVPKGLLEVAGKPTSSGKSALYARRRLEAHKAGRAVSGVNQWKAAKLPPAAFPHLANQNISAGVRARRQANLALSKQWGANNSVGKAVSRDDRKTLAAAGVGAAGLGTLRVGAEMHHRALSSVPRAQADLAAHRTTVSAARRGLAEREAQAAAGNTRTSGPRFRGQQFKWPPGTEPTVGRQKTLLSRAEGGQRKAMAQVKATRAAVPGRVRAAVKTKNLGLLAATAGALGTVHYARAASRNRYSMPGY